MSYQIKGFNPHTFIDWEGKIACVIYLPGCNFRCPFCHSSGLVLNPQEQDDVPFEYIEQFLKEKEGWLDGVVIGGGEPTLYEHLPSLARELKRKRLLVKIDTNGTNPNLLQTLLEENLIDYVAMDIKAPLIKERYEQVVKSKADTGAISESINILMQSTIDYEFRTTLVPTLIEPRDITDIARSIQGAKKYVLQQFDPKDTLDKALTGVKPYPAQTLHETALLAGEFVQSCVVRGV